eukprot:TRINITY_DN3926_c0_g1_i1.p5 TRINITY_DN3926_c0_g1~~TRINITY_DN3926_c0_g1_i1.p5  ORF type:complete len:197 (-),score=20.41 TRINITY_DN3926_c0_g1_i1:3265-3855(-)
MISSLKTKLILLLLPLSIVSLVLSTIACIIFLEETVLVRYITLALVSVFCVLISAWIHAMVNFIVNPLAELNKKLHLLNHYDVELALDPAYNNASSDIHVLYDSFSTLSMTFNFASNALAQKDNETLALLSYADSYQMFKGKNEKATGICMNNIGNIHYRARRYNEAAKAYEEAIQIAKKMIEEQVKQSSTQQSWD